MDTKYFRLTDNFVDDSFNLASFARSIENDLHRLSMSFYTTGNEKMSDELSELATKASLIHDNIIKICQNRTSSDFKKIQEMQAEVINKILTQK
jgi:hypothetical protein